MTGPQSPILDALYHRRHADAERLAAEAGTLSIWEAAALGYDAAVTQALGAGQAVNAPAPDGHLPLGLAAFFGRASTVRLLLRHGADVHAAAQNPLKVQPLHAAVAGRSLEAVTAILEAGGDVNARQQVGYTPLMGAAASGRDDLVALLLRHGADASLVSDDGKTAADVAREHQFDSLADRLAAVQTG
ncbi:MAG TPA: ankyrin repeat domain-containing protein [Vicinamibacterales bacterium]|nr:ankyrin repeat domain-containing protein [Vicinamibacterales bacterium]